MGAHVEFLAAYAEPVGPGTVIGENPTDLAAVVIGESDNMAVVQGTPAELKAFARSVVAAADRAGALAAARADRIEQTVMAASLAFWSVVGARWPEATTGDFPPDATIAWESAAKQAVSTWVGWNATTEPDAQPTDAELAAQHAEYVADSLDQDETPPAPQAAPDFDTCERVGLDGTARTGGPWTWEDVARAALARLDRPDTATSVARWPQNMDEAAAFTDWQAEVAAGDTTLGFREWWESPSRRP